MGNVAAGTTIAKPLHQTQHKTRSSSATMGPSGQWPHPNRHGDATAKTQTAGNGTGLLPGAAVSGARVGSNNRRDLIDIALHELLDEASAAEALCK